MTAFQIIGLTVSAIFALLTVAAMIRHRITRGSALAWLLLWIAAGVAFWEPELTRMVANRLGIQRGADLVFYCAILAMFVGFFLVFAKLRRVEDNLTTLVREIAVRLPAGEDAERDEA